MNRELTVSQEQDVLEQPCAKHPNTLTAVACGKCGIRLCPRCMVFTPVGVRCRNCANLRRPAQFDVSPIMLATAGLASLIVAFVGWTLVLHVGLFAWFMAVAVGLLCGEVASRAAKRRVSRSLQIVLGLAIVIGFLASRWVYYSQKSQFESLLNHHTASTVFGLTDPFVLVILIIAMVLGVTRLNR